MLDVHIKQAVNLCNGSHMSHTDMVDCVHAEQPGSSAVNAASSLLWSTQT